MLMLPLQNQNTEATPNPPPYSTANISTLHANPQRSQPSQTNHRQDSPPKQDEVMPSMVFLLITIDVCLSILILTGFVLFGRNQVFISIPVTSVLNVSKPKAQNISQNSTAPIFSFTTEFDCLENYLNEPEFKHKKIEGSFDFLRFKTTLAKSEYYESSLQSSCPHLDTQNVGQILTFSENCHHENTFILNKYFGVIDSVLLANIIFLMLSFPLHVCIYAYSVFGVILFAVPWTSSFALQLTAIIYNNKIDRKIRSISNICFQPHVLVTGITPKFKNIIISITLLYIIELITITFNYIYLFTSKRQEINNDEALQEIT